MIVCVPMSFNCTPSLEVKIEKYIFIAMSFNFAPTFEVKIEK
jgi:hypothetical protein